MKKIKLFFAILFSICTFSSVNAQTKQETMDFIASNMKKYLNSDYDFVSYSNGVFKYSTVWREWQEPIYRQYISTPGKWIDKGTVIYSINLNKLTGNYGFDYGDWHWQGSGIYYKDYSRYFGKDKEQSPDRVKVGGTDMDEVLFNFYANDGMWERMKKAVQLLIKYNQKESDGGLFMD